MNEQMTFPPDAGFEQDDDSLVVIRKMAAKLVELTNQRDELLKKAEALTETINDIANKALPDLFEEVGLESIKLPDGTEIISEPFYHGRLTDKTREAALQWLKDNEAYGIVRNKVDINLPRGAEEAEMMDKIREALEAIGAGHLVQEKSDIHHSTLKAFIREQCEQNPQFPKELFNVFEGKTIKIKSK